MKFLSFLIFIVSVVQGQNFGSYQSNNYGTNNVPVIKDGVPEDTPEVQAAKAAHFQAYERARALAAKNPSSGQYQEVGTKYQSQNQQQYQVSQYQPQQQYLTQNYQQQQQQHQYLTQNYQSQQYQPQQQYQSNVIYSQPKQPNYQVAAYSSELPVNTPEVQQARSTHLTALSQAQTHHYRYRRGIYFQSLPQPPEDTPEVQAARYQHYVAHATAHYDDDDDFYYAPHDEGYHIPIITKKGVPSNTAPVKAARQQHRLAHQLAKSGAKISGGHSVHEPVIAPNGVPYDTPEVYIAKIQHFKAHVEESTKQNQLSLHESGFKV